MPKDSAKRFWSVSLSLLLFFSGPSGLANEETASVYFFHALKAKEEGRLLTAERLFQKAVEIEPENPDFRFELGNLYILRNNLHAARLEFEQALMAAPQHIPARYNLGLVYRELGLTSDARNEFRKILELDPTHQKAQLQIGYTYAEEGFTDEARDAFEEARQMDISNPEPEGALEDLDQYEAAAKARSDADLDRRLWRNQSSLGQQMETSSPSSSQVSGKDALLQAGVMMLQGLLARRANNSQQDSAETE